MDTDQKKIEIINIDRRLSSVIIGSSQVIYDESDEQVYLTFCQHIAEWDHAVPAVGNVVVDLVGGLVFMFAVTDVGDDAAVVECFAHCFGAVANGAILTEDGRFV